VTASPLKICLVGCGRVALHYVEMLTKHVPQGIIEVVSCADINHGKAENIARLLNSKAYSDYVEMIEREQFDYAFILTESGNHYVNAKKILELGKSVLIEKPVALLPQQACELSRISDEMGLDCFTVFQNRYNPAIRLLNDMVIRNLFGKLVTGSVRLRWCRTQEYYDDGWHGTWKMDGGVICQQAIHHLDCLISVLGLPCKVVAQMGRQLNRLEAEDTMTALLAYENGCQITLELTTAIRPEDFEASISIFGENGYISLGGIAINKVQDIWVAGFSPDILKQLKFDGSEEVPTGYGLSHKNLLIDLFKYKNSAKQNHVDLIRANEAKPVLQLIHAIYVSCETESWVDVNKKNLSKMLGV